MEYSVDKMIADDWEQVRSIYLEGIATGNATFEAEALAGISGIRAICKIAAW